MKVLLIGDMHIKISNMHAAQQFLQWISTVISKETPDLVVNLGDSFDTHAVIRSEVSCELMSHIYGITNSGIEYVYVLGNHDFFRPDDSRYHAMLPYKDKIDLLHVIDEPSEIHGITFIPYTPDQSKFPVQTCSICMAHQTFAGCDFGGYKPDDGLDPDLISADIIISGHIHKRQSFGKVYYPGSPYSQSMKDIGQVKGVSILDTDTFKIRFIKSPLPMWRSLELDIRDGEAFLHNADSTLTKGDNWVISWTGPRKEISSLLDSKQWKEVSKNYNISVRTNNTDSLKVEKTKISGNTVIDIVNEYVDRVYTGAIDKKEIKSTMRQLLDTVDKK